MEDVELEYDADVTSVVIEPMFYDTLGFCDDYTVRRHKHEEDANKGSHEARTDWCRFIGPIDKFGGCNPFSGHFASLVLPMCRPERLGVVAYVLEYAFLYDNVLESAAKTTLDVNSDHLVLDETTSDTVQSVTGTKQIQAKMILDLLAIDKERAEHVVEVWKNMVSTTAKHDKTKPFTDLEEYISYRIVDTGAPFVDAIMQFGMGLSLGKAEEGQLANIVRPCYAALGLANDYFSFDIEYDEFKDSKASSMTNAVWLYMKWHDVDVETAKTMVKDQTIRYEREFQELRKGFLHRMEQQKSPKLEAYLAGMSYQVSGNLVWSLTCPRYHPKNRYNSNAGIENNILWSTDLRKTTSVLEDIKHMQDMINTEENGFSLHVYDQQSRRSSESTNSSLGQTTNDCGSVTSPTSSTFSERKEATVPDNEIGPQLGTEHVLTPYEYISSLPSKGVRDAFIDALNIWLGIPEQVTSRIKSIARLLHNASLMLDDIEDSSTLRRGKPATHMIFGEAYTINSANFVIIKALDEVRKLDEQLSIVIFIEEMQDLHIGQSYDLYWTRNTICPTEEEYLEMVEKKTGGLFRLLTRLLLAHQTRLSLCELDNFVALIGRFFQIRDDYQNLASAEYTNQKGFCEDLDEGKYSYPLIHALNSQPDNLQLRAILQKRRDHGSLSRELKCSILEQLQRSSSLEYTQNRLKSLQNEIDYEIDMLERRTGSKNWVIRLLLNKLRM